MSAKKVPSDRPSVVIGTSLALAALILAGCAAMESPVNQEVALRAMSEGERVEASCDMANDHATWTVVAPVDVAITRSTKPVAIDCRAQNGATGSTVFQATKTSSGLGGGDAAYAYPERMELELKRPARGQQVAAIASGFATVGDASRLPYVNDAGRAGYARFLNGASPRAFAISDKGVWTRVNGARGAERVALERCQAVSGRCRIYAVDNTVVWEEKASSDMVARSQ